MRATNSSGRNMKKPIAVSPVNCISEPFEVRLTCSVFRHFEWVEAINHFAVPVRSPGAPRCRRAARGIWPTIPALCMLLIMRSPLATPFSTMTADTRGSSSAACTATPPPRLDPHSAEIAAVDVRARRHIGDGVARVGDFLGRMKHRPRSLSLSPQPR